MFSRFLLFSFLLFNGFQLLAQDSVRLTADVIVRTFYRTKFLPDSIFQMNIVSGKKVEVVLLNPRYIDASSNAYRQAFRKTPGIFVSEHDASGLQTSISTRGLSANRSWEFNMRQNGYDIAADPSGYPEAYFSPTMDAVASIEVYRGSSALQYGTQFGGLINYQLKDNLGEKPFSYEGAHTSGSFGLVNSFNAIGGIKGKWSYYGFIHHRQAEGFRTNSRYFTHNYYAKTDYSWKRGKITAEYHHSYYLNQQAGGLHDSVISTDPRSSIRNRNWFELPWKMASIQVQHTFKNGLKIHSNLNYLHGNRNSVGFMKPLNVADTFNTTLGSYNLREIDLDIYNTLSSETRFNQPYKMAKKMHVLSGGVRYCLSDIHRLQKGIGSGDSGFDLSVSTDNNGNQFLRDLDLQTQNLAIFTENIFQLGKRLSLVPGYRIESIRTSMAGRTNAVLGGYLPTLTKDRIIMLGGMSAKFSIANKPAFACSLYANANQNYRPVMYSELLPSATTETIDSTLSDVTGYSSEIGIKGHVLHRHLMFFYDLNAYYIRYNNKVGTLQINGNPFKTNLGDLASKGVELYSEVIFMNPFLVKDANTEELSLFFSGTMLDARYVRWDNPGITGNAQTSIVGKKAEYAPELIVRGGLEYRFKTFGFSYQIQHTSACFSDAANTPETNATATVGRIPSLTIHDVSLSNTWFENFQLKVGINNLLNSIQVVRRTAGYPGPGALSNQGRSLYASLNIKF